jgi:hypothetical protein
MMVHVRPAALGIPWLQSVCAIRPLVLVGGREDLLGLPVEVQALACGSDRWLAPRVIMRLGFALARLISPSAPAGVPPAAADSHRRSLSEKAQD